MLHLSITFPEDLKAALDREVKQERTKRSTLIQTAVRVYIGMKRRKELNERMRQGYIEMGKTDRQMNREWEHTLSDGLDV